MNFRTFLILKRLATPVAFLLPAFCFYRLSGAFESEFVFWLLMALAAAPLAVIVVVIGWYNRKIEQHHVAKMNCPVCGEEGLTGRTLHLFNSWWFRCSDCGIVTPTGMLGMFGLHYSAEPVDDEVDEE
ncbi:MAG: hypothetical protein KDA69_17205 [Planctomycetaceae bacterium]|nr:hypothetical protein [Planctomycetaceae bacterium]MCA9046069.1 hypothetical protein [Planctomycetaceae bacterium]MCB9950959.1 hypothetical protein [Planctomycetaceae bacterium]